MTFGSFCFLGEKPWGQRKVAFAKELGVSASNLCYIEKGRQLVGAKKAAEIANLIRYFETVLVELAINEQLAADGLKLRVTE